LEDLVNGVSGTKSKPLLVPISKNLSSRIAPQRGCEFREAGKVGVKGLILRFMDPKVKAVAYEEFIPGLAVLSAGWKRKTRSGMR
jgi:hypothetical protein